LHRREELWPGAETDESFNVVLVEDRCAAGTDELHRRDLEIINMIHCHVASSAELLEAMGLEAHAQR